MISKLEKRVMRSRIYRIFWNKLAKLIGQHFSMPKDSYNNLKALEIGTGQGLGAIWFAENTKKGNIIGIDLEKDMVDIAKRNVMKEGLERRISIMRGDATNMHFKDQTFDIVMALGVLHHIPEYGKAIKEVYRVLKENGSLFILEFNWNQKDIGQKIMSLIFPPACWIQKNDLFKYLEEIGFEIEEKYSDHVLYAIDCHR